MEIRNELLRILHLMKSEDKDFELELLLERFEIDIKRQLEDLQNKEKELNDNLQTLEFVRNELLNKKESE